MQWSGRCRTSGPEGSSACRHGLRLKAIYIVDWLAMSSPGRPGLRRAGWGRNMESFHQMEYAMFVRHPRFQELEDLVPQRYKDNRSCFLMWLILSVYLAKKPSATRKRELQNEGSLQTSSSRLQNQLGTLLPEDIMACHLIHTWPALFAMLLGLRCSQTNSSARRKVLVVTYPLERCSSCMHVIWMSTEWYPVGSTIPWSFKNRKCLDVKKS